jgi:hypothetical protein
MATAVLLTVLQGNTRGDTNGVEQFEYLLKTSQTNGWRVTQVFRYTLGLSSVRVETSPAANATPFSRAAVYRKENLVGFIRLLQPLAGGFTLARVARSIRPSEIRYNDQFRPFELVKARRTAFDGMPQERRRAVHDAIAALGSNLFQTRQEASALLTACGREILEPLSRAVTNADPEVRFRAEEIRNGILQREQPIEPELAAILLRKSGRHKPPQQQGFLGVSIEEVKAGEEPGAMIMQVVPGSPAHQCGLQIQDIITAIDADMLQDSTDVLEIISAKAPGSTVKLAICRNGREMDLKAVLASRPQGLP